MKSIGEFLIGVLYVAIVYTIVRPGSPAAGVVTTITGALGGIIRSATGYQRNGG